MRERCFAVGSLVLMALTSLTACSGALFPTFGHIRASAETTQAFENHSVNPDNRYYYSGCEGHPNVVVGLHQDYRIAPLDLWKPLPPSRLGEFVEGMRRQTERSLHFVHGFTLHDPQRRVIGVWYSLPWSPTCLEVQADGSVRIDPPDVDTYDLMNEDAGWSPMNG